jgi:hypothetical protein
MIAALHTRSAPSRFFQKENIDRRAWGAIQFVNGVDGTPVKTSLTIELARPAPGLVVVIRAGRNGIYVLHEVRVTDRPRAEQLADYESRFEAPPGLPAQGTIAVDFLVTDSSGEFLPRLFSIALPLNAARLNRPQTVQLFPSAQGSLGEGWAVWRMAIWRDVPNTLPAKQAAVPLALLRVLSKTENENGAPRVLARALTDWRTRRDGARPRSTEALLAIPGLQVTQWNRVEGGAVTTPDLEVTLEVRMDTTFDPGARRSAPDLARLEPGAGAGIDPDVKSAALDLRVRARERRSSNIVFNAAGDAIRQLATRELNLVPM